MITSNHLLNKTLITFTVLSFCLSVGVHAQEQATQRQEPAADARQATGLGRGRPDTPRYYASSAAATRAIAICSGLWSANQTMEDIDFYSPLRTDDAATFETEIDEKNKTVSIAYDDVMPPRIVVWRPVLGCTQLPVGASMESAKNLPQVKKNIRPPNLDDKPWPLGDQDALGRLPESQQAALDSVVDKAFDQEAYGGTSWGVIVVKDGKIVAEKYALNFDKHKGAQTHSAAKSFASSLVGITVKKHGLDIKKTGVLKAWRRPGDPRGQISIEHLLHMSSGLYGEGNGSPQADIYSNGTTVEGTAVTNFLNTMPGTRFLYNPPDTMLLMRAVREKVDNDSKFWAMPFTELFWKIGMTRTVPSSDWNGDFLMSGQTYSTARDFARFGLLYLNKGEWDGEQILPVGWDDYVSTKGPVQPEGSGARYGAQFWIYDGMDGLPDKTYSPAGGQGQYAVIIPAKNLVVVRRGYDGRSRISITKFAADVAAVFE